KMPVAPAPGFGTFCSHCGNKVPEGSAFCNRCGSSIIPPVSTAPATPAVPDYRAPVQRPVEREIQAIEPLIEPLIEPSSVKVPADQLMSLPPEPVVQKTVQRAYSPMYDNPPEPAVPPESVPVAGKQQPKPAVKSLIPRLFSPKELSPTPLNPASMPSAAPPPPKKPRGPSRMPGKKVFMAIGAVILLIVIVAIGVVFVLPMISGSGTPTPGTPTGVPAATSTPLPSGTLVVPKETTAPDVPATGVYARVSYLGGWKGTYGLPAALLDATNSGDRFLEIENATGPVVATFEKLDGSTRHELVVEIYKNGGLLTSGKSSEGFGKVTVSADATTGVAEAPQAAAGNVTSTATPVTNVTTVKTTTVPVTNVTTVKTTAPVANTTTSSP
ncbi:MAG: zinc-ribbon domain-containing protein, partial [Methanoregula sp.]|nr:zinc-ribbon domain-containing protein [Methanoregula sp.]